MRKTGGVAVGSRCVVESITVGFIVKVKEGGAREVSRRIQATRRGVVYNLERWCM